MNPPDPVNAFNGMSQGAEGFAQGNIGSSVGRSQGPSLGINRAATGGPNMDQSAPNPLASQPGATGQNATRQTQGIFSFLSGILPIASVAANLIPGVGPLISAGLGAITGSVNQNKANQAAGAANSAQAGIAQQLASGPQLDPLIKQEQAGISSAVQNSNAANPGKLMADLFGGAFSSAIGGVASNRTQALEDASNIYGGQATAATTAANAQGNPFTALAAAITPNTPGSPGTGLLSGGAQTAPGGIQAVPSSSGGSGDAGNFNLSSGDNPFATTMGVTNAQLNGGKKPATGAGSK